MIKLTGYQELDFTTKEGDQIKGTKIHYVYTPEGNRANNAHGQLTDTHFFSAKNAFDLPILVPGNDYEFLTEFDGRRPVIVGLKPLQSASTK